MHRSALVPPAAPPFLGRWAVMLAGLGAAAPAWAQDLAACGDTKSAIAWTQPPRKPVDDPEATRWPVDATMRIAYGGTRCPSPDEFELYAEDGTRVPAQVRIEEPPLLVAHDELPLTLIEVDPVPLLAPRTTHTLIWRAPEPKLASFENFTLEFKTLSRGMEPLPLDEFEGILAVQQREGRCGAEFGNPVLVAPDPVRDPPGCTTALRILVEVRFRPVNRRDIAYEVVRTSSTPLDGDRQPLTAEGDRTPVTVAYIGGGEDFYLATTIDGYVRVALPASPQPRRDCFAVHLLDGQGLAQGGDGEACIDVPFDLPCLDPESVMAGSVEDPIAALTCPNVGLNGADPNVRPPAEGDNGAADGGVDAQGSSDGCCRVLGAPAGGGWWLLVGLPLLRRRRRGA